MNYYNPYYMIPAYNTLPNIAASAPRTGLFSRLLGGGGIKWSSILNGTQKTLNILNQGIPLVRQASPLMKNAKTMFRLMNEFKKVDTPMNTSTIQQNATKPTQTSENIVQESHQKVSPPTQNGPTFFI